MKKLFTLLFVVCLSVLLASCGDTSVEINESSDSQITENVYTDERTLPDGTPVSDIPDSQGLKYTQVGKKYYVAGRGSCTDRVIVIPNEHNGLPVTAIMDDAFSGDESLEGIVFGKHLTHIGEDAFAGTDIKYVVFASELKRIGEGFMMLIIGSFWVWLDSLVTFTLSGITPLTLARKSNPSRTEQFVSSLTRSRTPPPTPVP